MKTKRLLLLLLVATFAVSLCLLSGCGCKHEELTWIINEATHKQVCVACRKAQTTDEVHQWEGTTCTVCNYGAEYSQGLEYELSSNGVYYAVTGCGTFDGDVLNVSPQYNGLPVHRIAREAFYQNATLTKVILPNTIDYIGEMAFINCVNLKEVTLTEGGANVTIGRMAFAYNPNLPQFTIPSSVTEVKQAAFYNCHAIVIYSQTTRAQSSSWDINWNADYKPVIWDCNNNDKATDGNVYVIYQGLTYAIAGGQAKVAKQVQNLTTAHVVASVPYKGSNYTVTELLPDCFAEIAGGEPTEWNLKEITFDENCQIKKIGDRAFENCIAVPSIVLPNTVTTLGESAFRHCWELTEFVIPAQVTKLPSTLFQACSFTKIVIPKAVNYIDRYVFVECYKLKEVVFEEPKGWSVEVMTDYDASQTTQLSQSELSQPETAAQYLTDVNNYATALWKRA